MSRRQKKAPTKANPLAQFLAGATVVLIVIFFVQSALRIHEGQVLSNLGERLSNTADNLTDFTSEL